MPSILMSFCTRDAANDLNERFDMPIIRRGTRRKQIPISRMLVITIIAALLFAYIRDWNVPVSRWPLLCLVVAFVASMAKLLQIAIQDSASKGVRRQYRQFYDQQAELAKADSPESDTMAPNAQAQGAENESAAD